jgi:hypothetical protein
MARGSGFFPMGVAEKLVLGFLVAFSIVAFLPPWRALEIGGMSLFGWLLAALMVVSPALTLLAFGRGRR